MDDFRRWLASGGRGDGEGRRGSLMVSGIDSMADLESVRPLAGVRRASVCNMFAGVHPIGNRTCVSIPCVCVCVCFRVCKRSDFSSIAAAAVAVYVDKLSVRTYSPMSACSGMCVSVCECVFGRVCDWEENRRSQNVCKSDRFYLNVTFKDPNPEHTHTQTVLGFCSVCISVRVR